MKNGLGLRVLLLLALLGALQQQCEAGSDFPTLEFCEDDEDVPHSRRGSFGSACWTAKKSYLSFEECDCGDSYKRDDYGRCTLCAVGYTRNIYRDCVHCSKPNERWCRWFNKCVCSKNFQRDLYGSCFPCGPNEESDGYSGCQCLKHHGRNDRGVCELCGMNESPNYESKKCECYSGYKRNSRGECYDCSGYGQVFSYSNDNEHDCDCEEGFERGNNGECVDSFSKDLKPSTIVWGLIASGFMGFMCGYVIRQYKSHCVDN